MPHGTALAKVYAVAAITQEGGLGCKGRLPWHPRRLFLDMAFLKMLTTSRPAVDGNGIRFDLGAGMDMIFRNSIIMGRKTWESLPPKLRPLPERHNIVISTDHNYALAEGVGLADTLDRAYAIAASIPNFGVAFVLGGAKVYEMALADQRLGGCFITELVRTPQPLDCDVMFPVGHLRGRFVSHVNVTREAYDACAEIDPKLKEKVQLVDRNGEHVAIEGEYEYVIKYYFE